MKTIETLVVFILICAVMLSACSKPPAGDNPSGLSDKITITFADFRAFKSQYEALIEEFQAQYPNITVLYVPIDEEASGSTLSHQRLASLADVLTLPILPESSDIYSYLDLKPLQESDANFAADAFWPGLLDGCRVEGRTIGLPTAVQPFLIFYNRAVFDNASVQHPSTGWDWEDFANAARLLTERQGDRITRYGFVDRGHPFTLLAPMVSAMLVKEHGEQTDTLTQALDWYVSLALEESIPVLSQEDETTKVQDWVAERQAAMWLDSLSSLPERRQVLGDAVGVAPFPMAPDGSIVQATRALAKCAVISAGTAHPQEAWAWLQFLTTRPTPMTEPLAVPARIAVAVESDMWINLDDQTLTTVRYALNHAWYSSNSGEQFNAIEQALIQAMTGESTLVEALSSIPADVPISSPPTPNSAPLAVATPDTTAIPVVPSGDEASVKYFVNPIYGPGFEVLKPLAEAFTREHPDITIQLVEPPTAFGEGGFNFDQVAQQFDCFAFGLGVYGEFMTSQLYSLNPLIEADPDGKALLDDLPSPLVSINQVNGELYSLPVSSQPAVVYYNRTLLSQMGLQPPALDWTLDDFWMLASMATDKDVYGFVPLDGIGFVDFLLTAQGVRLYDLTSDPPVVNFDAPGTLSVVSMLTEMFRNEVVPAIEEPGNRAQREGWVVSGNAVMWVNPAGLEYGFFAPPGGPGFEVGIVPMPSTGKPLQPAYDGVSLYISRQARDPFACWEWIKYLSAQPDAFLGIPARRSVLESPQYEDIIGPEVAAAYRAVMAQPRQEVVLDYEELFPSGPLYIWWAETLTTAYEGLPPSQALAELQTKAQVYLDCLMLVDNPQEGNTWIACAKQADPVFELPHDR